ncbi:hypothetical protein Lesp02_75630 [Lentzea sp. NBRC 105346]|uniref:cache domain-containing protein n=1 Tax=Lentzea sp. NBRC 105346 TaxID=3032205 RepID=UPI0024A408A1|nr:cache domain-containing protein [Lentzea sp. NBRC 105346]GLZ35376.1 hypothetical protein Lesp02_75630 [Lentzea sp. NBRC 105346]
MSRPLTEAGFPSGARVPLAVTVVALLSLAVFCGVRLGGHQDGSSVEVVASSHQWFAENLARSVGESVREAAGDLAAAVRRYGVRPDYGTDQTIEFFAKNTPRSRGLAVVNRSSGKLLASAGEAVPIESLAIGEVTGSAVRVVADHDGGVQTVIADVLTGTDRLVIMSMDLAVPAPAVDSLRLPSTVLLATDGGEVIGSSAGDELITRAAAAATSGTGGHLVGAEQALADGRAVVPIVAYSPVTTGTAKARLGISVLLSGATPPDDDAVTVGGLWPALSLLGVTLVVALLIGGGLVRPVRRLRRDAMTVASGQSWPGRRYRISETRRIAGAFGATGPPGRCSALVAVVLAFLVLIGWSGGVLWTLGRQEVRVPQQAVEITQSLAANTAHTLRRSLQQSLTDLRAMAARITDTDELDPVLQEMSARHPRYRSVYVIDPQGVILARAGRKPLRAEQPPPDGFGLHQQDTAGRVPIIYAAAQLADGKHVVIGELDVVKLSALARKPGGVGRLVDSGLRTVAATVGFRAYEELTAEPLRRSVTSAMHGAAEPAVHEVDGRLSVVAAAAIYGSQATNELQWTVVIEQPVSQLPLPGNHIRRGAWLAALVAAVVALGMLGWHLLVLVLPLRRLASVADRFAAGDTRTVIYPQRPDEIGTVARCLELHRQAKDRYGHHHGPEVRDGGHNGTLRNAKGQ